MISKLIRKISKRNYKNDRPNRNESGIENFINSYVSYYDCLSSQDL